MDGAGGGGGSCYISLRHLWNPPRSDLNVLPGPPRHLVVSSVSHNTAVLEWDPPSWGVRGEVLGYVVEMAMGSGGVGAASHHFRIVATSSCSSSSGGGDDARNLNNGRQGPLAQCRTNHTQTLLSPESTYAFRVSSISRRGGRGQHSRVVVAHTRSLPMNAWVLRRGRPLVHASADGGLHAVDPPVGSLSPNPGSALYESHSTTGDFTMSPPSHTAPPIVTTSPLVNGSAVSTTTSDPLAFENWRTKDRDGKDVAYNSRDSDAWMQGGFPGFHVTHASATSTPRSGHSAVTMEGCVRLHVCICIEGAHVGSPTQPLCVAEYHHR